jgi:hypothetical protein
VWLNITGLGLELGLELGRELTIEDFKRELGIESFKKELAKALALGC